MEYFSESGALENARVKYHFRYPIGGPFGNFYRELSKSCRTWLDREYSGYSGRGLLYRLNARVVYSSEDITSVVTDISVLERGSAEAKKSFFAENWLDDGRILPLFAIREKNMPKSMLKGACGYFVNGGEICLFDEKGQKIATGVKYGKICQAWQ